MIAETDPPDMVRVDIAALRKTAAENREEAALLIRRAQGQEDRANSMERRLAARIAAEAVAAHNHVD
jgi:hypothetical protein